MGQESLEKINIQKYLIEWRKGLVFEMDKQYLYDHFKIGNGSDKGKIEFYQLYIEIFCSDNCELSEWIWKKINGFFEYPFHDMEIGVIKSLKYQPIQNITNIYNNHENWKTVEW
jgi:hypothetical protein